MQANSGQQSKQSLNLGLNLQVVHYLLHIWNRRSDLFGERALGL
jgi:hypothetical protein